MDAYQPPVDRFLHLDETPIRGEWIDYAAMGFGPEHSAELIRMATDPALNRADADSNEVWAPVHAWRVLGLLRDESAAAPLVGILADQPDEDIDEWAAEEIPEILGMIGPAAIPPLVDLLGRGSAGLYSRTGASNSLVKIAEKHPEARSECVAAIAHILEQAEANDPALNGFLISDLIDLGAGESAGVVERAYAGDFVDDSIPGTWFDAWQRLVGEGEPPPKTAQKYSIFGKLSDPASTAIRPPLARPAFARRSAESRKDRNKARQKLEQKVKGKKGKRR